MDESEARGDCTECDARCCRYIVVKIPAPRTKDDVDEIRWFLAHENIHVMIEEKRWYLKVNNRCRHLDENNRCLIHEDRFDVCREYDTLECEAARIERVPTIFLRSVEEFDAFLEKRRSRWKHNRKSRRKGA